MHINRSARPLLDGVLERYERDYRHKFSTLLDRVTVNEDASAPRLRLVEPVAVRSYCERVNKARRAIGALPAGGGDIDDGLCPFIRDALVWERLAVARRVEVHRTRTLDPNLTASINEQLEPYDQLMNQPWVRGAPEVETPQVGDYFPLHAIEEENVDAPQRTRILDEKFHILQAPSQFLNDLHKARSAGHLRGISCAVAYIDLDDFKSVNKEHGEPFVDLNILPRLMRALEAHIFQRGHAYRFGGDEYGLLIHNTTPDDATRLLDALRKSIAQLTFLGTKPSFHVTCSIGFLVVGHRCHLTGLEIESRAASAKQFAKSTGKNRVASYDAPWFDAPRVVAD
jgi:diguanylate cyclase (GGDEF)-like protein